MTNDITTKIKNIANSINYDSVDITTDRDIDWNSIDLSEITIPIDWSSANALTERVANLIDDVEEALRSSRLRAEKKEACKTLLSSINDSLSAYVNADPDSYDVLFKKYSALNNIRVILTTLEEYVPASKKREVSALTRSLSSECSSLNSPIENNKFYRRRLGEIILKKAFANRINKYVKEIEKTGLSLDVIRSHNDEAFADALKEVAYKVYGTRGSVLLVYTVWNCEHSREDKKTVLAWDFPDNMLDFIHTAKSLGIKDIYFYGDSTATLETLYIFAKEGATISYEKLMVGSSKDERTVAHMSF